MSRVFTCSALGPRETRCREVAPNMSGRSGQGNLVPGSSAGCASLRMFVGLGARAKGLLRESNLVPGCSVETRVPDWGVAQGVELNRWRHRESVHRGPRVAHGVDVVLGGGLEFMISSELRVALGRRRRRKYGVGNLTARERGCMGHIRFKRRDFVRCSLRGRVLAENRTHVSACSPPLPSSSKSGRKEGLNSGLAFDYRHCAGPWIAVPRDTGGCGPGRAAPWKMEFPRCLLWRVRLSGVCS